MTPAPHVVHVTNMRYGPSLSVTKFKSSFQRIECFQRIFRLGCSECRSFPGARDIYYFIQNFGAAEIYLKTPIWTDGILMTEDVLETMAVLDHNKQKKN